MFKEVSLVYFSSTKTTQRTVRAIGRALAKAFDIPVQEYDFTLPNARSRKLHFASDQLVVVGSPVYYAGPNGSLCALLDRVFYSCGKYLAYKPGAAVAVCRRGGASATFDRLNKYFTIMNMPVVPSQYWNSVHGRLPGEAREDAEGLQTMRVLARNMARLLKAGVGPALTPEAEERQWTHFIR